MGKAFSRLSGCLRGPAQEIEQFKKVQDPKKRRRFLRKLKRKDVNFQEESVVNKYIFLNSHLSIWFICIGEQFNLHISAVTFAN
jgi:hypothetical protein